MSKFPSQMQDKFNLRFPDGMRDAIAERAKANGRSMNSEIIQILGETIYQVNQPDDELERLLDFLSHGYPENPSEAKIYADIMADAIHEITLRIDRENSRLKMITEAHNKRSNKKPT